MGKASSKKKVARAAKAGGSRARAAGERNLLFPSLLILVFVLGLGLVVYARQERSAEALVPPIANQDHWHAAYGIDVCGEFQPNLPEFEAITGTHTHGDGLIHIHPFAESRSGENATLLNYLEDAGLALTDDSLTLKDGTVLEEGADNDNEACAGAILQVAYWASGTGVASDPEVEPRVITENFDDLRFLKDGEAFTIAFAKEGADIPPPPSVSELADVSPDDLGVSEGLLDEAGVTSTTVAGDETTDSTEVPDASATTDTTLAGDTPDTTATTTGDATGTTETTAAEASTTTAGSDDAEQ